MNVHSVLFVFHSPQVLCIFHLKVQYRIPTCFHLQHLPQVSNFDFSIMSERKLALPNRHASAPVCKSATRHRRPSSLPLPTTTSIRKPSNKPSSPTAEVLPTAEITSASSLIQTEVPDHIDQQPLLRPFDTEYRPKPYPWGLQHPSLSDAFAALTLPSHRQLS